MALTGFLLGVLLFVGIINTLSHMFMRIVEGAPAKDSGILEMFEKRGEEYTSLTKSWEDLYSIEARRYALPRIKQNKSWYILYPYIISEVGVVPRWYKSKKVIDAKFAELVKGSGYDENKRKKLGLD